MKDTIKMIMEGVSGIKDMLLHIIGLGVLVQLVFVGGFLGIDIVSNLISEENDKLKVGIDYLQGDKSALLDIATEDRLGFTLSTKISDKILLNGKIGVPVGGLEQTLIVGNVQIDFILNEEGSLRAKVFNKENEFRYIGDELGYTQGVGISYDVDFNTFKEMIQKIVSNKRELIEPVESRENKNSDIVKFIKKN